MDPEHYLRFIFALILVIGLILLGAAVLRRYGLGGLIAATRGGARRGAAKRRLGVVESVALDGRRRLVLVRRDAAEHLLVIGGGTDLVVERGIPGDGGESFSQALSASGRETREKPS